MKLPPNCHVNTVDGVFIWLSLPECDVDALAKSALEHGVAVVPSSVFYRDRANITPALRLNFTNACIAELGDAIERLAKVIKLYC